jgi:hypothetical protein
MEITQAAKSMAFVSLGCSDTKKPFFKNVRNMTNCYTQYPIHASSQLVLFNRNFHINWLCFGLSPQ